MTQKNVELVIGRLASDEDLRALFRRDRRAALRALQGEGLELSAVELDSLMAADSAAFDRLAAALDPRLQKASLRPPNGRARRNGKEGR
jgi:hypothetical protein